MNPNLKKTGVALLILKTQEQGRTLRIKKVLHNDIEVDYLRIHKNPKHVCMKQKNFITHEAKTDIHKKKKNSLVSLEISTFLFR